MSRWRLGTALAVAAVAVSPAAADSEAPRWLNVDGPPAWVAGAAVDQKFQQDWRGARLEPGAFIALRVPARADLRLVNPTGTLRPDDLEIAVSNGSGMYRLVTTPEPDANGHVTLPRTLQERLVRIAGPPDRGAALTVAAFVSSRDVVTTMHRRAAWINETPVTLRWSEERNHVQYWPIGGGHWGELTIEGPTHVLMDTVVALAEDAAATHSGYRVSARLDDDAPDLIEFAIRLSSQRAYIDGRERVLGRRQTTSVAVPPGRHRLSLHADAEVYARVSVLASDHFLLPVNAPPPIIPAPEVAPGPHWELSEDDVQVWAHGTPAQREGAAHRLARDNHRRGGGLLAAHLMEQTALAFPDNPRLVSLAAAFARRYTMHRQVLPHSAGGEAIAHRFHWFAAPQRYARIAELAGRDPRYRQLALASLESAHFFDLEPQAELVFAIPPHSGGSHLRVAALVSAGGLSQSFQVKFDDDGSSVVHIDLPVDPALRDAAPFDDEPEHRLSDAAVQRLTLLPPFASRKRPARLVQAASIEIPLPRGARSATLRGASGLLRVTAQYRVSRRFALTETEHEEALRRAGPEGSFAQLKPLLDAARRSTDAGVQAAVAADIRAGETTSQQLVALNDAGQQMIHGKSAGPTTLSALGRMQDADSVRAARRTAGTVINFTGTVSHTLDGDLASHRAPLVRWLATRYLSFRHRTATANPRVAVNDARVADHAYRMADAAQRFAQAGAWQSALDHWRRVASSASHHLRVKALAGQYQAFLKLGEPRLAEDYLRHVFLNDGDPALRDEAFEMLSSQYSREANVFAQEMLLATAVLRDASSTALERLIRQLLENGRAEDALTLTLAMAPSDRPLWALVQGSYDAGWWPTFDAAVAQLTNEAERQLWLGYRALSRGELDTARNHWSRAGFRGRQVHTIHDAGMRLRDELDGAPPDVASDLAVNWAHWHEAAPGAHRVSNAAHLLYASAGGAVLHWPDIDGYRQTFRGEPDRPVRLRVYGPQQLEIQARMVLDSAAKSVDDWLEVGDGQTVTRFSLVDGRPQPEIDLIGTSDFKPSRLYRFVYDVGPGEHDITLAARSSPLLMQVYTRVPQLPLMALPILTAETLDAVRARGASDAVTIRGGPPVPAAMAAPPTPRVSDPAPARQRPVADAGSALRRVTALVGRTEQVPALFETAIAETERLYAARPQLSGLAALKSRLERRADWELLRSVQTSAGSRLVAVRGWAPESPRLILRKALSDPVADDEVVITGERHLGVNIAGELIERLEVQLTLGAVDFASIEPMNAYYSLDGGTRQRVRLHAQARSQTIVLPIDAGQHHLRIGVENPYLDQYLRVRLLDADRNQPLMAEEAQRLYHVATGEEPVRFAIRGPAWLRIHGRNMGHETHEFRYLSAGWQTLTLAPEPGAQETLYRVYRRVRGDPPAYVASPTRALFEPLPAFATTIPRADLTPPVVAESELIRHRTGGWSMYAAAVDRRNFDEDQVGASERFGEFGGQYRYRLLEHPAYFRTTFLTRIREHGGPTLGIRERMDYRPETWPFNLRLDADVFAQRPGDELDGIEWSARVQARVDHTLTLRENIRHRPMLRIFARYLSLDEDEISDAQRVDQDVFSQYKHDHRHGLSFEDILTYTPWVDTRWYGGPALTTNEDFDPFNPDYVQVRIGWTQLIGDWVADVRYQYRRYFSDSDRSSSVNRHQLRFAVNWDPLQTLRRWHLSFSWIHDLSSTENSLRLALQYDFGAANGSRDYYPGEVRFLGARRQRTSTAWFQ